jgi:hypothetical protein
VTRITDTIVVAAAPEHVFAWVEDAANARLLIPQLEEIVSVKRLPNGGRHVTFRVRGPAGRSITGESTTLEHEPPHRMVTRIHVDAVRSVVERRFMEIPEGTRIEAELDYEIGGPVLGMVTGPATRGRTRAELRRGLETIREHVEAAAG